MLKARINDKDIEMMHSALSTPSIASLSWDKAVNRLITGNAAEIVIPIEETIICVLKCFKGNNNKTTINMVITIAKAIDRYEYNDLYGFIS